MKKTILLSVSILLSVLLLSAQENKLSFAFMTDVHLNTANHGDCNHGLKKALDKAKSMDVDFVILGGDNADIDGLVGKSDVADELYGRFKKIVDSSKLQVYPCIGNHDLYWDDNKEHPLYGTKLFEKYFGETFYSFDKEGVHFIVLNSVQSGGVGAEQQDWLKRDLESIGKDTPIIVTLHVPILSLYYPAVEGKFTSTDMIKNFKEIWDMFENHNLQLVLQGHQHLHEEMFSKGTWFVTGGAICAGWWGGSFHRTEEGFLHVTVDKNNNISWKYIDYGWDVGK